MQYHYFTDEGSAAQMQHYYTMFGNTVAAYEILWHWEKNVSLQFLLHSTLSSFLQHNCRTLAAYILTCQYMLQYRKGNFIDTLD